MFKLDVLNNNYFYQNASKTFLNFKNFGEKYFNIFICLCIQLKFLTKA